MRGVSRSSRYAGRDAVAAIGVRSLRRARSFFPARPDKIVRRRAMTTTLKADGEEACDPGAAARAIGGWTMLPLARKAVVTTSVSPPQRWCTQHRTPGVMTCSLPFQPLRAERRMPPARPWRRHSCAFYLCTRGCGCARASGVPRALMSRVERIRSSGAPAPSQQQGRWRMTPKNVKRFSDQVRRTYGDAWLFENRIRSAAASFTSPRSRGQVGDGAQRSLR